MEKKSQLYEEGYGKGWLYKDNEFIDVVGYHYQIVQLALTTQIRLVDEEPRFKYRLSGRLTLTDYPGNIFKETFLLLVTKGKGFQIRIDRMEDKPKTYHFVQEKKEEPGR